MQNPRKQRDINKTKKLPKKFQRSPKLSLQGHKKGRELQESLFLTRKVNSSEKIEKGRRNVNSTSALKDECPHKATFTRSNVPVTPDTH